MITPQGIKKFTEVFKGSDKFYLADPNKKTIKKNGGERWGVKESSYEFPNLTLEEAIQGHLDGTLRRGVVLPPIRRSDSKCCWGAIDIDGNIYKDDDFKKATNPKLAKLINNAIMSIDPNMSYKDFAKGVAQVLIDEYGVQNYEPFISELKKELDSTLG